MSWEPFGSTSPREASESGILERVLAANRRYADGPSPKGLPRPPARHLIVVTCMDARIDPYRMLGLNVGDAHVMRNAGAVVSDDVLRSIEVSRSMGTTAALVVGHTDCAGHASEEDAVAGVLAGVARIEATIPKDFAAHGLMYDVRTARLRAVGS